MQPPCPLQLSLCDPSSAPGEQWEEKLLFEKFWKGTFKAVATPRPGSVIMASITARRRVIDTETTACQPLKTDERKVEAADMRVDTTDGNGCIKDKGRKHHRRRRARSASFDDDLSPRRTLKGKKKKRKSERKRKRKRYTSKKSKHSSSSLKRKRKDERKHKKSSRSHRHRRRRYRRSGSESSACRSSTESRHHLQKSVAHHALDDLAGLRKDTTTDQRDLKWRPAAKSVCKMASSYRSILSTGTILPSKPGDKLLHAKGNHHHTLSSQIRGPQDYDSGNDTSSPPSTKTGVSRASVTEDKRNHCQGLATPEKLKFTEGDNASDSGNSVTSYASLCKPHVEGGLSASLFNRNGKSEQMTFGCRMEVRRSQKTTISPLTAGSSRRRQRTYSSSSRSRSRTSGNYRHSGRYSRSLSSGSSYSRSPSYSADLRRRGSVASASSKGSYSRYSPDRQRDRKRKPSLRERDTKHTQKNGGKRRRRKSYSPMKKRRRDSPSHLEARRITSARKRPIPYFRPSPSSSGRSTSVSSWSSLFTRSRSRSPSRSISRSRSRSRSYSSYRSYSRSSSWNSIFGTRSRSRSRSYALLNNHSKSRH